MYKKIACMNIQMGLNGCSHSISARNFRVAVHFERYVQRAERERAQEVKCVKKITIDQIKNRTKK